MRAIFNKTFAVLLSLAIMGTLLPQLGTAALAQESIMNVNNDASMRKVPADAVAMVGDHFYTSLEVAINASSPEQPAIMLKDVVEKKEGYSIHQDNAVLNTNGFTLEFKDTRYNLLVFEFNQTFTIHGSGNKHKPDLIIGQVWINPGKGNVDKEKGLFLNNVYLKSSNSYYESLLSSAGHLTLSDCKIDAIPKDGNVTRKQKALNISTNPGSQSLVEFYGHNIVIGDIMIGGCGSEERNGTLEVIDGKIMKNISIPNDLEGCKGDTLSTVALPIGWEWEHPNEMIDSLDGFDFFVKKKAKYIIQDNYDYSHYDGYNKEGNYVVIDVMIHLICRNEWIVEPNIEDWNYGEQSKTPVGQSKYGTVEFSYKSESEDEYSKTKPSEPGNYLMKASVGWQYVNFDEYKEMEKVVPFTIHKITPTISLPNHIVAFKGDKLSDIALPNEFTWKDGNQIVDRSGEYEAIYTPNDSEHYSTLEVKINVFMYDKPIINEAPRIEVKDITLIVGDQFDPLKDVTVVDAEGDDVTLEVMKNNVDLSKVGTYEVTYKATDAKGASMIKTIKIFVNEASLEKEELKDFIREHTSNIHRNDYTKDSYDEYLEALNKSKEVLNNKNATKDDIKKALNNLESAYKALNQNMMNPEANTPETSDSTNLYGFASILVMSGILFVIVGIRKRKLNRDIEGLL